jgi:hypothetical protein
VRNPHLSKLANLFSRTHDFQVRKASSSPEIDVPISDRINAIREALDRIEVEALRSCSDAIEGCKCVESDAVLIVSNLSLIVGS